MTSILTPIQCSHLIDRPCPLVRRPGRWGVLCMRGEASAVKQRATDKPRLATIGGREGMLDCGVSRARCTLTRLNPSSHMQEHMCNGCETLCVGVCVCVRVPDRHRHSARNSLASAGSWPLQSWHRSMAAIKASNNTWNHSTEFVEPNNVPFTE